MKNLLKILLLINMFFALNANATNYYYCNSSPAKVTTLTSWKTNSNCTGTSPASFTNSLDVFYINRSVNINQAWNVSGRVIINSNCNIVGNGQISTGTVDVGSSGSVNINNANIPSFGILNLQSTITINYTSNYYLPIANYGSLLLMGNNTNITLNGNTTVNYLYLDSCFLNINDHKLIITDDYEYLRKSVFIGSSNSELSFQGGGTLSSIVTFSQTSSSNKTLKSLTLNGTGVTIDSSLIVTHLLDLTANSGSTLTTNDNLYLTANSSYTAQVANMTSCTIVGKIHYQLYIPASGGRYWYHITAPLSGVSVAQWQTGASTNNGIYVTGTFTGASNPGNGIIQTGISAYSWDAINQAWSNFPKTSNTQIIGNTTGYRFFIRDGNAALAPTTPAKTINNFGNVNSGTISYSLYYNSTKGGWNMLGNPYPADISSDLSHSGWTYSNLASNNVWIWDADAGVYVACNGGVGDCIIPPGQSFWVETTTNNSIQLDETVKTGTSTTTYKIASSNSNDYFNVKLINGTNGVENNYYLRLSKDYTNGVDSYDAVKKWEYFQNTIFVSISGVDTSNNYYNIDSRDSISNSDTIKIHLIASQGIDTLSFNRSSFSYTGDIYLHDKYLNTTTLISGDMIYPFSVTSNTATITNRFYLTFYKSPTVVTSVVNSDYDIVKVYPNPSSDHIQITSPISMDKIEIMNSSGQIVLSKDVKGVSDYITINNFSNGVYTVRVHSNNMIYINKLIICK